MAADRPVPSLFRLDGRTALVTGAGRGIGQAIATGLAEAGADLVLLAEHDDLGQTRQRVQAHGREVDTVVCDLARLDDVAAAVTPVLERHRVDILVNNAGIILREPAAEMGPASWHAVVDVNLNAVFRLSQLAGRPMLDRGHGKIVNVASLLSFQGGMLVASYAASKHGVAGLTKALANEWAPHNVQVNAIAPGYVDTAATADLRADEERDAAILARIPAGRWGRPEDLRGAAVFLASPASDYVNGHVLVVDGGWMGR
ncbi:MAG: 2-dehydro-3-deoxy-D-gluconate 5-dehydrogenase KduD [Actinomycetota bacterium]|nr:2-dehydro-3-deoxy-D-gluconate 5-dehydrogenase KduD [Actinomycetota bacterium]